MSSFARDFCTISKSNSVLAQEFEVLHGIPYIIGAIDGSHIPILGPIIRGED
jgi:hypothetical protein